jgi:hypothetical protein
MNVQKRDNHGNGPRFRLVAKSVEARDSGFTETPFGLEDVKPSFL